MVNRMFITLEGKGILRACTEEFMLASRYKPHDELAAEFIRTFRHRAFRGKFYIDRYENMQGLDSHHSMNLLLPKDGRKSIAHAEQDFYGLRSSDPNVFY